MVSAPAPPADRSKEIRGAAEAVAGRAAEAGRGGAQEARGSATAAAGGSDSLTTRIRCETTSRRALSAPLSFACVEVKRLYVWHGTSDRPCCRRFKRT